MGRKKWTTYEVIRNEAVRIGAISIGDLRSKAIGVHASASKKAMLIRLAKELGWDIPDKKRWSTYKKVLTGARKVEVTSKTGLKKKALGVYLAAEKNNWLNQLSNELGWQTKSKGKWSTFESIKNEAIKVKAESKSDLDSLSRGAYLAAWKNGYLEALVEALDWEEHTQKPSNAIYIWQAHSAGYWNDKPIYKIGINTFEDGLKRIKDVSRSSGFDSELIINVKVKGIKAKKLEKRLHNIYEKVSFNRKFDGSTEFRALNTVELKQALDLIGSYTMPA